MSNSPSYHCLDKKQKLQSKSDENEMLLVLNDVSLLARLLQMIALKHVLREKQIRLSESHNVLCYAQLCLINAPFVAIERCWSVRKISWDNPQTESTMSEGWEITIDKYVSTESSHQEILIDADIDNTELIKYSSHSRSRCCVIDRYKYCVNGSGSVRYAKQNCYWSTDC